MPKQSKKSLGRDKYKLVTIKNINFQVHKANTENNLKIYSIIIHKNHAMHIFGM